MQFIRRQTVIKFPSELINNYNSLEHIITNRFLCILQEIAPTQYPKLFGEALESDMLMMILKILLKCYDR